MINSNIRRPKLKNVMIRNDNISSYLMMFPYLVFFALFTFIPVISSMVLSLTYFNLVEAPRFIGLENYFMMFLDDDVFLITVKNTLIFALVTGPVGYILSFIFAWLINELGRKTRALMTLVFYGPSIAGNAFIIWLFIFSGDAYGLLNSTLMRFGLIDDPIIWLNDTRYNLVIVMIVMLWMSMGAGFLAFIAGLQTLDKSLAEAAAVDGIRNRWQELWLVTIPQMGPQLMFGAVMQVAAVFSAGQVSMTLTGFPSTDYSTDTIVTHMMDFGFIRFEMGYASALAVILFAAMILTKQLINKMLKKYL